MLIFEDFLFEQNAPILQIGENRHRNLNFSVAKSFCSTYFKLLIFFNQLFGSTVPNFGVNQVLTVISIKKR